MLVVCRALGWHIAVTAVTVPLWLRVCCFAVYCSWYACRGLVELGVDGSQVLR